MSEMLMETEQAAQLATAHDLFLENVPDFIILLMSSCSELATNLWENEMIGDVLYSSIINKSDALARGPTTSHDMTRAMLNTVYKHLKQPGPEAYRIEKWTGFIKALKKGSNWELLVQTLGKYNCHHV